MIQCGPYGPNHATAGTFAFKTKLLEQTKYEDSAALAEERAFLKDYTIPFIQLDPLKSILVFSHEHNTFDKRKMFDQKQDEKYFKESQKTVDTFIRHKYEDKIKKFFMEDIDALLDKYDPGKPNMKPDVLKQMAEIEAKREQMIREYQQQQFAPIMLSQEGKPPIQLTSQQIVQIITQNREQIDGLIKKTEEQQRYIQLLQNKLIEVKKNNTVSDIHNNNNVVTVTQINEQSEKDQLIAQIKILTQRNEILESRLSNSQTTISKIIPEVNVVIDNDE